MPCTSVSLLGQLRQANLSLEASGTLQLKYYGSRRSTSEGQPASPTDCSLKKAAHADLTARRLWKDGSLAPLTSFRHY